MKRLFLILRIILGGIFLFAGIVKAPAGMQFTIALVPFTIIPISWLGPIASTLPWLEITAGGLILIGATKRIGAALVILLCLIFCLVIGWALANGIIVSCACFGRDETPSAFKMTLTLFRDFLLIAAATAVLFENHLRRRFCNRGNGQKTPASG